MIRALALSVLLAGQAAAQTPAEAAATAADRLSIAAALLDAAQGRRDRVAALTETVTAYEAGLAAVRDGLRRAASREAVIASGLEANRAEIGQLLAALQAIGRAPAPLLLLHPNGALGTARGGMIAADVTPALQSRVDDLALQLQELRALQTIQAAALEDLTAGLRGAQQARADLSAAIAARTDLPVRFADDPVQTALLLSSTETLAAFASGLADVYLSEDAQAPEATAAGALNLPVPGQIVRGFNQEDAAGIVRPGWVIATRPRAMVTTPVPATLLFHGPLLDYGNVVILEPAADTMFVLAGLSEVFGAPGQVLPAGTPVGLMGGDTPSVDGILTNRDGQIRDAATETLYLEVRDMQSPVDPATWFAQDR